MISINEIMNTELMTLKPDDSLWDAVDLMNEKKIRHIPIMVNDKLQGLVTQRDVLKFMYKTEAEQKNIRLSDIMVAQVISVDEDASIRQAALFLQKHKLGCLPVVSGEKLVGIVTDTDFVAVAINLLEQAELNEPLEDDF